LRQQQSFAAHNGAKVSSVSGYRRYVAIGDSQTEGLWDGDDSSGLVGFADRLATMLDSHYPGLTYANLALRSARVGDVIAEQLPRALAMQPDLITVCAGMNDVIRPGPSFHRAMAELDDLYSRLAESGAAVITTTFPDIARLLPIGRFLASRTLQVNDLIRSASRRYGFHLVELYGVPSMLDPDIWSDDRVHGSMKGHILFAEAAAEALGLPSSNHDWAQTSGDVVQPSFRERAYSQLLWTRNMLVPWIWRHLRGLSGGHGRTPKRPELEAVTRLEAEY
jgi:lysophospholipase L1-like esterase